MNERPSPTGTDDEVARAVLADCARLREQATSHPMTVATAIERANWFRKQPELLVDSFTGKQIIDTLLSALEVNPCYLKAVRRGYGVFVLVESDRAAPAAIGQWALDAASHGCPDEKVQEALRMAEQWRNTPRLQTKWPD